MIEKIFKFIFFVVSVFGTWGFGQLIVQHLQAAFLLSADFLYFAAGAIIMLLLWIFYFADSESFWQTLEHELTHALFAVLFLKKINALSASRRTGGRIHMEGGNFLIALSPYFFPLISVFFLGLKLLVYPRLNLILNGFIGLGLCFHFLSLVNEFHWQQPDIRQSGYIFSLVLIVFFNLFFCGLILFSLNNNGEEISQYLRDGWKATLGCSGFFYEIVSRIVIRYLKT